MNLDGNVNGEKLNVNLDGTQNENPEWEHERKPDWEPRWDEIITKLKPILHQNGSKLGSNWDQTGT